MVDKGREEVLQRLQGRHLQTPIDFSLWLGIDKPNTRNKNRAEKAVAIYAATFDWLRMDT